MRNAVINVIINDGSLEDLQSEVKELHERLISEI